MVIWHDMSYNTPLYDTNQETGFIYNLSEEDVSDESDEASICVFCCD